MNDNINYNLLLIALPIIGAIIGYFLNSHLEKKRQLLLEISKERRELYQKFVDLIIGLFDKSKEDKKQKEIISELNSFYKKYVLYASPKVINAYSDYFQLMYINSDEINVNKNLRAVTKILKAMRADIGLKNKGLGKDGERLMRALLKDFDKIF